MRGRGGRRWRKRRRRCVEVRLVEGGEGEVEGPLLRVSWRRWWHGRGRIAVAEAEEEDGARVVVG